MTPTELDTLPESAVPQERTVAKEQILAGRPSYQKSGHQWQAVIRDRATNAVVWAGPLCANRDETTPYNLAARDVAKAFQDAFTSADEMLLRVEESFRYLAGSAGPYRNRDLASATQRKSLVEWAITESRKYQ